MDPIWLLILIGRLYLSDVQLGVDVNSSHQKNTFLQKNCVWYQILLIALGFKININRKPICSIYSVESLCYNSWWNNYKSSKNTRAKWLWPWLGFAYHLVLVLCLERSGCRAKGVRLGPLTLHAIVDVLRSNLWQGNSVDSQTRFSIPTQNDYFPSFFATCCACIH